MATVNQQMDSMMSPDDMMDMTTEGDFVSRKETPEQAEARKKEAGKLASGLANMAADATPFVGGAKAATELPEDLKVAYALVQDGYSEGDLKQMGMGTAFGALSLLGLVPGVKIAADVGKSAIKSSVKKQTDNLITSKRAEQLEYAKTLPKGERRRFLKEVNRPTPRVFHGSPEMGKITAVEEDVLQKSYEKLRSNVNLNKQRLLDIFVDKDKVEYPSSKDIKKLGYDKAMLNAMGKASKDRISLDELIDGVADNVMLTKPMKLGTQKPGTYIPEEKEIEFKYREEPDVGKPYLAVFIDGEETSRRIIIDKDMTVRRNDVIDMFDTLNSNEYNKSSIAKLNVAGMDEPRSKAERLEQDGFVPYSEFEGDIGLGMRETRGKHQELGKQMLSTSRDPLVSLKGGFANFDPSNVVSAPLKKSEVRGMSPEMYDDISNYRTDSNIARIPDEPMGLPKSMHLESEVALSKPEELSGIRQLSKESMDLSPNVGTSFSEAIREGKLPEFRKAEQEKVAKYRRVIEKDISGQPKVKSVPNIGKMNLEEKVLNGQGMANSLARRENLLHANFGKYGREDVPTKADAKIFYDDVRSYFKDLQSLGQYTEQYGARGTYDSFLRTQAEKTTRKSGFENNIKNIRRAKALPPEKMATLETIYDVIKRIDTISKSAETSNYSALRGISDKELSDLIYRQKAGDKLLAGDLINFGLEFKNPDGTTKQRMYLDYSKLGGADLKRLMFLTTQKLNRGGLIEMEKGGAVPMKRMAKQMELFEPVERGFDEGGLMDEGGMVDEESGNEVPPGSLREEVRDDIPAQLSEGEFVFPADVVRYIGLENLMRMRQEAKQGLAQMEAMGQMGNSEEATMPDNLPFDLYDLEVEDDDEDRNYNVGGYVPPTIPQQTYTGQTPVNPQTGVYQLPGTGITGYQPYQGTQTGYNPYGGATPYFQPVQFTGPQYTTATQTTNLPTFGETVGTGAGQYDELREYVNDAGQTMQIPFKDGKPIYPIPEGYKPVEEQAEAPQEEQTTVTPTLGQTQVVQDDNGKDEVNTGGGTLSFGGSKGRRGGLSDEVVGAITGEVAYGTTTVDPKTGLAVPDAFSNPYGFAQQTAGSFLDAITAGKFGSPLSLKDNQISILNPNNTGLKIGNELVSNATIVFDAPSYNTHVTRQGASKVTSRQEAASVIRAVGDLYGKTYDGKMNFSEAKDLKDVFSDASGKVDMDLVEKHYGEDFAERIQEDSDSFDPGFRAEVNKALDEIAFGLSQMTDQQKADFKSYMDGSKEISYGDDDGPSGPSADTVAAADAAGAIGYEGNQYNDDDYGIGDAGEFGGTGGGDYGGGQEARDV